MDSRTFLIALLFGALAAGLAVVGLSVQDRYLAYRAEQIQLLSPDPEAAASASPRFSLQPLREISFEDRRRVLFGGLFLLTIVSYVWLLGTALKVGTGWGVAVFCGNYLACLIFLICHPSRAAMPMLLHTLSLVLTLGCGVYILRGGL